MDEQRMTGETGDKNAVIDQKLRQFFDGKIVRKDLTKKIKEGANVPVYVLEFLLGQYCSSDDPEVIETGVENVKRILADNYVRPDEAQKILSMLRQRGMHTVIDKITVNLNMKKDTYEAEFSNLGIKNIPISEDYAGGQDELSNITLQYDTSWQQDVDALETRVKGYKAEKDAAEEAERQRIAAENAAKQEQSRKDQYSGKLPVEGMPVSCLKYTSLGEPDKRLNCKNFEKLEQNQKYFNVYWYDENGEMIAAGMCAQWKNDSEYMLKSFSQYYPSGGNNGQTFNYGNGGSNSGSLRDDYDNPEDLWEDNQDWYEDEDEAWDEWYDG